MYSAFNVASIDGRGVPRGWRLAIRLQTTEHYVYAPMGLHWMVRLGYWFRWGMQTPWLFGLAQ